jgi:2-hydroxychromene-2-carboxylate isomerase
MRRIDWYFDFISPYAYFARQRLREFPADVEIRFRPILFAGLLKHWDHKGPAEIPPKRIWTYRSCTWWALQHGVPFQFPAAHPFNPLAYLRLAIAAGSTKAAIAAIFEALWTTGADPSDPTIIATLANQLGVDPAAISSSNVKDALRQNTEDAIARNLFGVPTLDINGEAFWGLDAMDFALAYLENPAILTSDEMQRISALPEGTTRL